MRLPLIRLLVWLLWSSLLGGRLRRGLGGFAPHLLVLIEIFFHNDKIKGLLYNVFGIPYYYSGLQNYDFFNNGLHHYCF